MIHFPPSKEPTLVEKREMMKAVMKKAIKEDPELLNEIIVELRQEKLKKITEKLN